MDRYLKFQGVALREGFESIMRGKPLELEHKGFYVTPSIYAWTAPEITKAAKSVIFQTELFSPFVVIVLIKTLEEAVSLMNTNQYGLVNSIYSASKDIYNESLKELEVGMVNWNRPTIESSFKLPFGGIKRSGNRFTGGVTAPLFCTHYQSTLELDSPKIPDSGVVPGLKLN